MTRSDVFRCLAWAARVSMLAGSLAAVLASAPAGTTRAQQLPPSDVLPPVGIDTGDVAQPATKVGLPTVTVTPAAGAGAQPTPAVAQPAGSVAEPPGVDALGRLAQPASGYPSPTGNPTGIENPGGSGIPGGINNPAGIDNPGGIGNPAGVIGGPAGGTAPMAGGPQGGTAIVTANPATLTLDGTAAPIDLQVQGSAELTRVALEVQYDPAVVVLTAVEPGDALRGTGGKVTVLAPTAKGYGLVSLGASVAYPKDQAPAVSAGTFMRLTFAPLAVGSATISVTNLNLTDRNGQTQSPQLLPIQAMVTQPPAPDVQAAALAQTKALTGTVGAGGLALPDVGQAAGGLVRWLKDGAWTAAWLALLVLALLVVAVGWYFGRQGRPA